jgi:hypothetical protein
MQVAGLTRKLWQMVKRFTTDAHPVDKKACGVSLLYFTNLS